MIETNQTVKCAIQRTMPKSVHKHRQNPRGKAGQQGRHRNYDKTSTTCHFFFVLLQLSDKTVVLVILDIC